MSILNDILSTVPRPDSHINTDNGVTQQVNGGVTTNTNPFQSGINTTNGALDPQNFIFNAALILIWALGILAFLTFLYAGVKYITAGGDAEKTESAKKIIIGSIIGLFLVIGSYLIFNTAVSVLTAKSIANPQDVNKIMNQTYP